METKLADILRGDKDVFPFGNLCVHQLFEREVEKHPNDIAVIFEDNSLTYRELNEKANQIANYLIGHGLQKEEPVAICLERSNEMLIAILGVIKAGGAYVPIDPTNPIQRIRLILRSLDSSFLISTSDQSLIFEAERQKRPLFIDEGVWQSRDIKNPNLQIDENMSMVILYTSGTTGQPKGVLITHQAMNNQLHFMQKQFRLTTEDRVLQKSPYNFDISVVEFFWPLMLGATVVIAKPEGHKDPEYLLDTIEKNEVTTIHFVPSMLQLFLDYLPSHKLKSIKRVICGGEILKKKTELEFFSKTKNVGLYNLYGPTETTVHVTCWECTGSEDEISIPIGYPISNTTFYLLDENLNSVGPLETGELYIGGVGLSKGYYKQQALTDAVFVKNPFDENEKLYKTGDLCKYRTDGAIEYVGRNDFQVKLRGNRVELAEIEYVFEKQSNIKECVVCGIGEGENQVLVAYVTVRDEKQCDELKLRNLVKDYLPEYMVPSFIVKMENFPLSNNGKIDRKQLPNPMVKREQQVSEGPITETEKLVSEIWMDLLNRKNIGVEESFLYSGGNSIIVARLVARLKKRLSIHLTLKDVFEHPTIKELSSYIDSHGALLKEKESFSDDSKINEKLSYTQKRMWFINELEGENPLYNIPGYVDIRGNVDKKMFKESLDFMIAQNQVMQSNFKSNAGEPYIHLDHTRKSNLKCFDISEHSLAQAKKIAMREIKKDASIPFVLESDDLFRFHFYKLADKHYRFYYNFHHIIFDGWSESVFLNNLLKYYRHIESNANELFNKAPVQYDDYIRKQEEFMKSDEYKRQLTYWKNKLDGKPSSPKLSQEQKDRKSTGYEGETITFNFNNSQISLFERYCNSKGATLFMGMLTLYKLFIYRLSNETNLSVGIPTSGRNDVELENAIGMFINTLTIGSELERNQTFEELLADVKNSTLEALSNGEVPFEEVIKALQPNRIANQNPLFQYMFVFQNFPKPERKIGDLSLEELVSVDNKTSKFDLTLFIEMHDKGFVGKWEYRTDVFNQSIINRFTSIFNQLLKAVNENPDVSIEELPLLTKEEEHELIYKLNRTETKFPDVCMHELFEEQVQKTPNYIAAEYEGKTLTYKQLDEASNKLAHLLIDKGVVPDTPVGLVMNRSLNLVISILGILKAGGAYLPIEVGTPASRLEQILTDAEAFLCVTDQQLFLQRRQIEEICLEDLEKLFKYPATKPKIALSPKNLISVYYTSGSTGNPKGVSSTHQGWVNRMCWMQKIHQLKEKETVLQKTTLTFDDAAVEFFWPLMVGGKIALIPPELHKDPMEIIKYGIQYKVSVIQFVPSMLKMVMNYITEEQRESLINLRVVVSSGEALPTDLVNEFYRKMRGTLYNSWGATEVSIDSTCYKCSPNEPITTNSQIVSVGKPIDNNRIYVLDGNQKAVPVGVLGDLYIGGIGLARGYLNDPEKTDDAFIEDPYYHNELMYKTGDKGYLSGDGNIMFVGRDDNQVKIRGMRVELGEIENRFKEIMGVKEAVVLLTVHEDASKLVAYYTSDSKIEKETIRKKLSKELPGYMVPSFYMNLNSIPLNSNGKLNRKKLPAPMEKDLIISTGFLKPTNSTERRVLSIWQERLKMSRIGIQDNFFELGGHSLLAVQIVSEINKEFTTSISIREFFDNPTITLISDLLHRQEKKSLVLQAARKADKSKGIPLTDAQQRIWFLDKLDKGTKYNMPLVLELEGSMDADQMENAINQLIMRHESLRTTFINRNGYPNQIIHDQIAFELEVEERNGEDIQKIIHEETKLEFDLAKGPLVKGKLIKKSSGDVLILVFHHIISDGWSLNVVKDELTSLYNGEKIPEHVSQYTDYSFTQQEFKKTKEYERQLSYWKEKMSGEIPLMNLPESYGDRNKVEENNTISYSLSKVVADRVNLFSRAEKYTPFMTFLGTFSILLAKLTQQTDVVIGTPLVNRKTSELESAIGIFLNTLPLRMDVDENNNIISYLDSVKGIVLDAFDNQDIPFEKIVEKVQPDRNLNRNPLFDVLINFQSFGEEKEYKLEGSKLTELEVNEIESKFLITLYIKDTTEGYEMKISYRNDLFSSEQMNEFLNQYLHLLNQIVSRPTLLIKDLSLVTEKFSKKLPNPELALKKQAYPKVTDMIAEIVKKSPYAIAVEENGQKFTYEKLSQSYQSIACHLTHRGIQTNDVVAVYGKRGFKGIAAVLGALYADATFLNIDQNVPANRLKEMLRQSNTKVIIATESLQLEFQSIVEELNIPTLNQDECQKVTKENLAGYKDKVDDNPAAYIYFTSGTTGVPKGVLGSHNGLSHFISWQRNKFGINDTYRFAQLTNVTFDVYLRDIFLPLTSGATICIPDENEEVLSFFKKENITAIHAVPSLARMWLSQEKDANYYLSTLRYVFFAGEPLSAKVAKAWQMISSAEVISFYGQTETTLAKAYHCVRESDEYETMPHGKPLPDTQIYLLNQSNNICGVGEIGEIIVRTPYSSLGYLNSQDAFSRNRLSEDRVYRTGDLGRYLPDGKIQILGRNDDQVKVKGVQITKNEIITLINRIENVKESYLLSEEVNGETRLHAYIVGDAESIDLKKDVRLKLLKDLPMVAIPSTFTIVSHLPVTPNGKVDKSKLASLKSEKMNQTSITLSSVEEQLIEIWRKILSVEKVKSTDNFFELGGHSLLIIKMIAMIKEVFEKEISLRTVFLHPTVHSLAQCIEETGKSKYRPAIRKVKRVKQSINK